eukprot:9256006-Pyramimonas_sp.AAC.1
MNTVCSASASINMGSLGQKHQVGHNVSLHSGHFPQMTAKSGWRHNLRSASSGVVRVGFTSRQRPRHHVRAGLDCKAVYRDDSPQQEPRNRNSKDEFWRRMQSQGMGRGGPSVAQRAVSGLLRIPGVPIG